MDISKLVLVNLLKNEEFTRKALTHLDADFFQDRNEKLIFSSYKTYFEKYGEVPSKDALSISLKSKNITEEDIKLSGEMLSELTTFKKEDNLDWLVDETEKFCQERSLYNAILDCIQISDGGDDTRSKHEIPQILKDALGVSFSTEVGHDYFSDVSDRYDFFHKKETRIPFDMEIFNTITSGGLPPKTLSVLLAGTGVGKSLVMCQFAKSFLVSGKNVLYITMEMAEEWISQRIDANLLDIKISELDFVSREDYVTKLNKIKDSTEGRLFVKEYPTTGASVVDFENLLNELEVKKNFIPDIIFIDYINICASKRITKMHSGINSYTMIKSIAEEIRGLAAEKNVPIVSATQTNREGYNNSDVDMSNTSESFGLPATTDLMLAIIATEELEELGQVMIKQLKNRLAGISPEFKRFNVGIDKSKMRLYELDSGATSFPGTETVIPTEAAFSVKKFEKPKLDSIEF